MAVRGLMRRWWDSVAQRLNGGQPRYLRGYDLEGNAYYEYPPYSDAGSSSQPSYARRTRRMVKYKEKMALEDYDHRALPIQWKMWLRHTRGQAPTMEELEKDHRRQTALGELVAQWKLKEEEEKRMKLEQGQQNVGAQQIGDVDPRKSSKEEEMVGGPGVEGQLREQDDIAKQVQTEGRQPHGLQYQQEEIAKAEAQPGGAAGAQTAEASSAPAPAPRRKRTPVGGGVPTSDVQDETVEQQRANRVPRSSTRPSSQAQTKRGQEHAGSVVEERTPDNDVWKATQQRIDQRKRGITPDSSGGRRSFSTHMIRGSRLYSTASDSGPKRPASLHQPPPSRKAPQAPESSPTIERVSPAGARASQSKQPGKPDLPVLVYFAGAATVGLALAAVWTVPDPWKLRRQQESGGLSAETWTPLKLVASRETTSKLAAEAGDAKGDGQHKLLTLGLPAGAHPDTAHVTQTAESPQQHLSISSLSLKQPDIMIERSYTPLQTPAKALAEGQVDLLIKKYENGEMGRYLHSLSPATGANVEVRGWLETWKAQSPLDEVVLIVGGTGIAPAHQLLESALASSAANAALAPRFKLLYAAPSTSSLLLLPELQELKRQHPDKLDVHLWAEKREESPGSWLSGLLTSVAEKGGVKSGSGTSFSVKTGRIQQADLKQLLKQQSNEGPRADDGSADPIRRAILVCGPEGMVNAIAGPRQVVIVDEKGNRSVAASQSAPLAGLLAQIEGVKKDEVVRL
ncbi:unnamed protein product [Jaminaea pallidilutea]